MKSSLVAAFAAASMLAACGGRHANPVSQVSVTDQYMNCTEIQATMVSNDTRAAQLRDEERRAKGGNVAIGVVGALLFWPALFALDTTDTEQVEISALQNRNSYLTTLMAQHQCGGPNSMEAASPPAGSATNVGSGRPARVNAASTTNEFVRCELNTGSIAMLTQRECGTWGGRVI
jgi:hypothetical protein